MRQPPASVNSIARALTLPVIVAFSALLAVSLHRTGHTQGDDFALYLRQARSLFDGDIGQVVSDNRFAVLNSDSSVSPIAYPWVFPLLLSPFVHLWGLDYDRLKLVEVGCFCLWLVLLHGIVKRRLGWWPAIAIVAAFGTAPAFLSYTDQLLTEFPHLAALGIVIWWYDRIRRDATLITSPVNGLIVLGALAALAFNVRRESIVLLGVIAVMAVYDVTHTRSTRDSFVDGVIDTVGHSWRRLVAPFASFAVAATLFQLLLPTDLLPDNGNSASFLGRRLGEYPGILTGQLGFGEHLVLGIAILAVTAIGVVVGLRARPTLDGPLALLAVLSALVISTHLRRVDRYWFQVTPWVVYFLTVATIAATGWVVARRARLAAVVALVPVIALIAAHLVVLPGDIRRVDDFNSVGRVQFGPSNPTVAPIFEAVDELTPPDAIVAYYRSRTMTLMTDRRSFQTTHLDRVEARADYFAQRRNSAYSQPALTPSQARAAGFEEVWSDQRWILWRLPEPSTP